MGKHALIRAIKNSLENILYEVHRMNCESCRDVDSRFGGHRCEEGMSLVRAAYKEAQRIKGAVPKRRP